MIITNWIKKLATIPRRGNHAEQESSDMNAARQVRLSDFEGNFRVAFEQLYNKIPGDPLSDELTDICKWIFVDKDNESNNVSEKGRPEQSRDGEEEVSPSLSSPPTSGKRQPGMAPQTRPTKKGPERETAVNSHSYSIGAVTVMRMLIPRYREFMVDEYPKPEPKSIDLWNERDKYYNNPKGSPESYVLMDPEVDKPGGYLYSSCFLGWPPNLFAFTSFFLNGTGVYAKVTNGDDWTRDPRRLDAYRKLVHAIASDWRAELAHAFDSFETLEETLESSNPSDWTQLVKCVSEPIRLLWQYIIREMKVEGLANWDDIWYDHQPALFRVMMILHAIADEVCLGWGVRPELTKVDKKMVNRNCDSAEQRNTAKVGQANGNRSDMVESNAARIARTLLADYGTMATIHPHRGRVLPKRHTPDAGVTLRSVSSHLAFARSPVKVKWYTSIENIAKVDKDFENDDSERRFAKSGERELRNSRSSTQGSSPAPGDLRTDKGTWRLYPGADGPQERDLTRTKLINILLLPWPLRIGTGDFKQTFDSGSGASTTEETEKRHYFRYSPDQDHFRELLEAPLIEVLKDAERRVGPIHLAVLPEAALFEEEDDSSGSEPSDMNDRSNKWAGRKKQGRIERHKSHFSCLESILRGVGGLNPVPFYIAGARLKISDTKVINTMFFNVLNEDREFGKCKKRQDKHHAWKLNWSQIRNYQWFIREFRERRRGP